MLKIAGGAISIALFHRSPHHNAQSHCPSWQSMVRFFKNLFQTVQNMTFKIRTVGEIESGGESGEIESGGGRLSKK